MVLAVFAGSDADVVHAQGSKCTVTGYVFNPDLSSAAAKTRVNAILVTRKGAVVTFKPIVLTADATGAASFSAPQGSTIWLAATAVGVVATGDVAILIPDLASADLNQLALGAGTTPIHAFVGHKSK
jgi:hypothetical protein